MGNEPLHIELMLEGFPTYLERLSSKSKSLRESESCKQHYCRPCVPLGVTLSFQDPIDLLDKPVDNFIVKLIICVEFFKL